jgi:energy-coupling factor transport system substrate-specific component
VTSPSSLTAAAANYLLGSENADGGFGPAPGQPSDQLYAGWAALGLASAGHDLNTLGDAQSLMHYVRGGAATGDVGALERTILVARAAGVSARSFGGRDLTAALQRRFRGDGSISGQVNLTAFAVLALRADGVEASSRTLRWLLRQQDADGGFSFSGAGGSSDVDDTGAALEALAGDGAAAHAMARAVAFLRRQQDRDGGFPSQPGMCSNAQSTAWAIQGLDAAGVSPVSLRRGGAVSPLAYLDSLVGANGAVRYSRGVTQTPVWVTGEALMAMEGRPLPIAAPAPPPAPPASAAPAATSPSHAASRSPRRSAPPAASPSGASNRASAHTAPRGPGPHRRSREALRSIASNQVLAGNFAGAVGVITALALAPVGLG